MSKKNFAPFQKHIIECSFSFLGCDDCARKLNFFLHDRHTLEIRFLRHTHTWIFCVYSQSSAGSPLPRHSKSQKTFRSLCNCNVGYSSFFFFQDVAIIYESIWRLSRRNVFPVRSKQEHILLLIFVFKWVMVRLHGFLSIKLSDFLHL